MVSDIYCMGRCEMGINIKALVGGGMVFLLSIICLAAAPSADLQLVEAVKNGDKAAVRSLLEQHVDVNATQADGATAVMWAAYQDDLEMAE
ncbi:MAG: ankyrin repeat domain-containing protein, partial [Acidobacteria bacterium]|nr:ankyrin repeat domain-containing protein [Acidobacteriota bacterium]